MLNYEVNETTDWETAYGEQHELYKATKKKLKKSRRKIKQLKKKKANAYGTEKRHIKRQLKAARNKVKALEKKLDAMEQEVQRRSWEYQQLKMQAKFEKELLALKSESQHTEYIMRILLQEALPGLVKKYLKSDSACNRSGSNSIIDDAPFTITDRSLNTV